MSNPINQSHKSSDENEENYNGNALDGGKNIVENNYNNENNFSLLNHNSNENGENNILANLLNDISGNEIQKEKATTLSKHHSKNSEDFLNHEIINTNSRLSNNSLGKSLI